MNKYISILLESLLDDDFFADLGVDIKIVLQAILSLNNRKHNKTEYPSNFDDYFLAETLADFGDYCAGYLEKNNLFDCDFGYKCEFVECNTELPYNKLSMYRISKNNNKILDCIFSIYVDGTHIPYIENNMYLASRSSLIDYNDNHINFYMLGFIVHLLLKYTIGEIRVNVSSSINIKVIKELRIHNDDFGAIVTSDIIDKFPAIKIAQDDDVYTDITKCIKNMTVIFRYLICVANLETMYKFLNLWKSFGFTKFIMSTDIGIKSRTPFKGITDQEDLFQYFMSENNFPLYSFTKKDKEKIENILFKKSKKYCIEEKNFSSENIYTVCYQVNYRDKGKDNKYGLYIIVDVTIEIYYDVGYHTKRSTLTWKFYKSGKCEIINEI